MVPTDIQRTIIEHDGNTVVLASPGSGKTFVLSEMIKRVIKKDDMLLYQGVIAISYTRKASSNLKHRTLGDGATQKNSFFGTIDNFCLTQIILPFGNYVFGHPSKELEIIGGGDLPKEEKQKFIWINSIHPDYESIDESQFSKLAGLFLAGYVLVESLELLALYIIRNCKACENFLKARFKYIFIDEFQDADTYTNSIFLDLVDMGITGVAVGDENQSIFGFAHKNSKYIRALKENPAFSEFTLNKNFRCAIPIINYSNRLLDSNSKILDTTDDAVFLIRVGGSEESIASFIDNNIEKIRHCWSVSDNSKIAILVKNGRTQDIINNSLETPHRLVETTILDMDLNPRSRLFALLLHFYFDESIPFLSILDDFVDYETMSLHEKKCLYDESVKIRSCNDNFDCLSKYFNQIADILLPKIGVGASLKKLSEVMSNDRALSSYKPVNANELQLMTLHKSKGLEFDVVFHLNVCEWELPIKIPKDGDFDNLIYPDWEQDIDLHYVGITRAKKACIMIRGTKRTNGNGDLKKAEDSEFLNINGLSSLRREN